MEGKQAYHTEWIAHSRLVCYRAGGGVCCGEALKAFVASANEDPRWRRACFSRCVKHAENILFKRRAVSVGVYVVR